MFQKEYLDKLGSKNLWRVMRFLFDNIHLSFGITEISRNTKISKSNVYRALERMENLGIVRTIKSGKKKLYMIETSSPLAIPIWDIVAVEKYMNIDSNFKNSIDLFIDKIDKENIKCLILFGSVARGLAEKWSDIDLCIVIENKEEVEEIKSLIEELFPEVRVEAHFYSKGEFESLDDFVVLEALLNGIHLLGSRYVFDIKKDLRSFPKSYLIYRINNVKNIAKRIKKLKGDAKEYFERLATVSLGEITAILERKTIIPKRLIEKEIDINEEIKRLEEEISRKGDVIWLT